MNIEDTAEKCEAEDIVEKCEMIVMFSALLGTATEIATSTILPQQECLRRLNKLKPGSSFTDELNGKVLKIEGDPNIAIRLFGHPPNTQISKKSGVESIITISRRICDADRSKSTKWSPLFIERMKLFAADFEPIAASHQHQSEIKSRERPSTPPAHKYTKRSKTIRYRSSPMPFLGRSSKRIDIPLSTPTNNCPYVDLISKYLVKQQQCDKVDEENTYPIRA